jgi:pyruvate kinase
MLADGTVTMVVQERTDHGVRARVTQPGLIRSRQGINLPGVKLNVPALDDDDRAHAEWAGRVGVDFVGLSFVRAADDVRTLKAILRAVESPPGVIAKIEKREALQQLESIVEAADAVMVARGDLGVEIDVAEMAVEQKRIIRTCRRYQKPVIIATQMLDSMQNSSRHAGRGDGRRQRDPGWRRRVHALGRDGNWPLPARGRRHDEPHCAGHRT